MEALQAGISDQVTPDTFSAAVGAQGLDRFAVAPA